MRSTTIRHAGRSAVRGSIVSLLFALAVALGEQAACAQVRITMAGQTPRAANPSQDPFAAVLQPSEEAMTLLRRAEEGVQRQDWKLAVDSLQRIVDLPGEHVLTSDNHFYESARRHAHRRIAALPPSGLTAYRLVHDDEAAALFAKAVASHDESLLHTVVDRYLCTRVGDDAAMVLADWLIDRGRFASAAALLREVQTLYPDSDLPQWAIRTRLAICAAGLGQTAEATSLLQASASRPATAPANAGLPPGIERQIAAYVARAGAPHQRDTTAWTAAYGGPARNGTMPLVEPTLVENQPSVIPLVSSEPRQEPDAVFAYARRRQLLPVRDLLSDGRLLLVKTESDILALDADSFTPVWSTRRRPEEVRVASAQELQLQLFWRSGMGNDAGVGDSDTQMEGDALVRSLLHDQVGTALTIASNMVLTVEWPGEPPPVMARSNRWQMSGGFPRDPFTTAQANRIAAYSLETGASLWRSEATGEPDQATGAGTSALEFLSAPLPVGDQLVAPCRTNNDLFAVVLDPATGKTLRQVYLCGTGGGGFDSLSPLQPTVADGVVFIPTGRGLLIALEAANWSIRWAIRYDSVASDGKDTGWLPTPPIAVADALLLAPPDSDLLFCLDRGTGEVRWRVKRDTFQYILAADAQSVWMAGRDVQLVDLKTGRPSWRRPAGDPTGRGALSGDRLYLPTVEGLVAMNAQTGEPIRLEQPIEPLALGNLLAWDGSLYSVSLFHVSRFPDLTRGYKEALARHAADPVDPARAIRLASLELLRHAPENALAALTKVPADTREKDARRHAQVTHLRVRAMLDMASDKTSADALRLLREARTIAISPNDAIESALGLGEYLNRKGEALEACVQYLGLALSAEGDTMMPPENGLERRARSVAVQRLAEIAKALPEDARRTLDERISSWLAQAVARHDADSVAWLAESDGLGDATQQAGVVLARWAVDDLRFEQAETYLARALRLARSPALKAEAAARLATIYLQPDELHQPVSALKLIERLEGEFAQVSLPDNILRTEPSTASGPSGAMLASGIAQALRKRVGAPTLARHRAVLSPIAMGPLSPASFRAHPNARPLTIRAGRSEPLSELLLLLVDRYRVEAHAPRDGSLLWHAELRLLGDPAVEPKTPEPGWQQNMNMARSDPVTRARGVIDGQTLIVNSDYGVHAIGLLTGRRLWSRTFDPAAQPNQDPAGSDTWIWSHDGYIVSVDARRRLEVAPVTQGDRALWRCSRSSRKWYAVRARGPYLVAVDADLEQADVFQLADGRYLGQGSFTQDVSSQRKVNITLYDDVICGPVSPREVVALELATPGVERWRVAVTEPLSQIFKPSPDLLAIADRSGLLQVFEPATGRKLMETRVEACPAGVMDGTLVDGILYVCGYEARATDPNDFEKQEWGLAAIKFDTGAILWDERKLSARVFLGDELLRASSNAIPVASYLPSGSRGRGGTRADGTLQSPAVELTLLDKKSGKPIGERMVFPLPSEVPSRQITDVQVWPGQVLVIAGATHVRFPFSPVPEGTSDAGRAGSHMLSSAQTPVGPSTGARPREREPDAR